MSASKNWQDKMKSLSSVLTAKQVAHAVRISSNELPKWEDYIDWVSNDRHNIMRDLAERHPDWTEEQCEEKAMEMESDTVSEEMNKAWDALESAANDEFAKHGLELTRVEGKWGPNEDDGPLFEVTPVKSWEDAAAKIVDTINGVGDFHFSSVKEFLRSGPYTARQAVLSHLGYIGWRAEVYGDYGASYRYEHARRNPGTPHGRRRNPAAATVAVLRLGKGPRRNSHHSHGADSGEWCWVSWGRVYCPDERITKDRPEYYYEPMRGHGHMVAVFWDRTSAENTHDLHCIGWMLTEDLGYDSVKAWIDAGEWAKREVPQHMLGGYDQFEDTTVRARSGTYRPRRNPSSRAVMNALGKDDPNEPLDEPLIYFYDIEWELDDDQQDPGLPNHMMLRARGFSGPRRKLDDWMLNHGADMLSDDTGWLVRSYKWDLGGMKYAGHMGPRRRS